MLEYKLARRDAVFDQFPFVETSLHRLGLLIGFGSVLVYVRITAKWPNCIRAKCHEAGGSQASHDILQIWVEPAVFMKHHDGREFVAGRWSGEQSAHHAV